MRRSSLVQRCPYFAAGDRFADARAEVAALKRGYRRELQRIGVHPRPTGGALATGQNDRLVRYGREREAMLNAARLQRGGTPRVQPRPLRDPDCEFNFDAINKLTTLQASAWIESPVKELAAIVDPRAWGLSAGVIDVAFPVTRDDDGEYHPLIEDLEVPLGTPLRKKERMLLFEYARSEVASFENILSIDRFTVSDDEILVTYHLCDCLKTTIGFLSLDGGLQRNDGSVRVTPATATVRGKTTLGALVQVEKVIRVRDLTPHDPGNPYDFGEAINGTLGAALSLWVDESSMMSPIF